MLITEPRPALKWTGSAIRARSSLIHAFGHAVIHAAQRIGLVIDAARFGKSGGAGGDHEEEGIEAMDFDFGITWVALNNCGFKKRRFDRLSVSGRK